MFLVLNVLTNGVKIFGDFYGSLKTSLFKFKLLWLCLDQLAEIFGQLFIPTSGHTGITTFVKDAKSIYTCLQTSSR